MDLKTTIGKHIDRVVETTKKGKAKPGDANDEKDGKREKWSEEFCAHFAKHCQSKFPGKSKSEKDVIKFCRRTSSARCCGGTTGLSSCGRWRRIREDRALLVKCDGVCSRAF